MGSKTYRLPVVALGAGVVCCALRFFLYRFGFDHKNILTAAHPLQVICLGLTVLTALYLLIQVLPLRGSMDPSGIFPANPLRNLAILAAGCLMGLYWLTLEARGASLLFVIRKWLTLAAALAMVLCALVPRQLRRVNILCRGIVTLFFALDMLCRYQSWSGNPQLPDYVFQVLACVTLCLCSYQRLAFDTGLGNRWMLLFCSLLAMYLSLVCAAGPETPIFYLAGILWAGGCLCSAEPKEEEPRDVPA